MSTIYLALGSNIDPEKNIGEAVELLKEKISDIQCAPFYRTKDFGRTEQPEFINTAIAGTTDLFPRELLVFVKNIEQRLGRQERPHWGSREIDIDIALYDDLVLNEPDLQIPHAGLHERDVVLQPLIDLDSTLTHPVLRTPIKELLRNISSKNRFIIDRL